MKKQLLLSTLLGTVLAMGLAQGGAMAATSASQTVTGTLGTMKQVITNGGNIAATIDTDTGALGTSFTPGFRLTTNTNTSLPVALTATCNTTTVAQNAFSGATASTTYLTLTNNTVLPPISAVTDAQAAAPVAANNGNVISYLVTAPSDVSGQLVYTFVASPTKWTAALTHKGNTDTALTIPAGAPKTNTYSFDDEPGSYQATVTLSFV